MTTTEITRRQFLASASAALIVPSLAGAAPKTEQLSRELAKIEASSGGRLGVAILDTATGTRTLHRGDERFPMCSTFKLVASAAVLAKVDAGKQRLDQRIIFQKTDLVTYSPITQTHTGEPGMTLGEICAAAIDYSDNTAANLILANIGGPAGFTQFARSIGDPVTRLDRIETALNESLPNDPRDTTTPSAMVTNLNSLLLGNALSGRFARPANAVAPCQHHRRHPSPRRRPRHLASRRQDRHRRPGFHQRHRHPLATQRQASPRLRLPHRNESFRR